MSFRRNPVVGLLGATTFAVLSGCIALFHTTRLLAFTWTVAAATLCGLCCPVGRYRRRLGGVQCRPGRAGQRFRRFRLPEVIRLIDTDILHGEIEPLTGLLNRDAFYQKAATLSAFAQSRR